MQKRTHKNFLLYSIITVAIAIAGVGAYFFFGSSRIFETRHDSSPSPISSPYEERVGPHGAKDLGNRATCHPDDTEVISDREYMMIRGTIRFAGKGYVIDDCVLNQHQIPDDSPFLQEEFKDGFYQRRVEIKAKIKQYDLLSFPGSQIPKGLRREIYDVQYITVIH